MVEGVRRKECKEDNFYCDGCNRIGCDSQSTTYVFSNLTPSTSYTVSVRAVCSDNNKSDWSTAVSFNTPAGGSGQGIESADEMGISLYPNPASSVVAVEANEAVILFSDYPSCLPQL